MEEFFRINETTDDFFTRCTNISAFDCSEEEMLYCIMGPRRLPLSRTVPISIFLLIIFLTGVIGNVSVCVVIVRHPSMHTDTNYYLFSLALSDLLLLLFGLPNDMSVYWHQYPYSLGVVFCKLRALISEAASYVSVMTIVAFTLERYLAICHPLHIYAVAGLRRALRIVLVLWVLSLLAASPFAHYTTVNYHEYPPTSGNASLESAFCAMLELPSWYICELSSFFFFLLPGLVILCLYIRMGLQISASYVSVMTIVAFTLERYLAICHPLHIYAVAGLRRALRIVLVLWVLSLLAASPFAHYTTVNYHEYPPTSGNASLESAFCAMLELPSWYICELSSFFFFLLPGLVILCLYIRMGLQIRATHSHSPGTPATLNGVNGSVHGEARQAQSRKIIIRMLAAVVIAFFVCWAPFHIQRLFFIYGTNVHHYHTINEYLFLVAGSFYYISATVNPILYNIMSRRYRIAFKETICCQKEHRKKNRYREQSSVRETTVNLTSDGSHRLRVHSNNRESRNRSDPRGTNRCSSDNSTLYSDRWKDYNRRENALWKKNNNEATQLMLNDVKYDCEL